MRIAGRYSSINEIAAAKFECGYLGTLLRLTLLAADIVEAILEERPANRVTLPALMRPFPVVWDYHCTALGN